jgi:hypothetical protein
MTFARHPFVDEGYGVAPSWVAICRDHPAIIAPLSMVSIYSKYGVANREGDWVWAKIESELLRRMESDIQMVTTPVESPELKRLKDKLDQIIVILASE